MTEAGQLDLRDPLDLERAEQFTAAVARAIAGDPALRFRGHLLHLGARLAPARAPHVRPSVDTQDMGDLRGAADGIALRVLHTDRDVYARFRPEGGGLEDLIYELLEQFRVEALVPDAALGMQANLHHRFETWSNDYMAEGLLENDVGLLVFAVVQVCRSRILARPIDERVNDHTEATRFGIYEVMGRDLLELRPSVGDQEAYAPHAAAIARNVAALAAETAKDDSGRPVPPSAILAMLEFNAFDRDDLAAASSDAVSRLGPGDGYATFTDAYDQTLAIGDIVLPHAQQVTRAQLDDLEADHQALAAYLRRSALTLFPAPLDETWETEQEVGYLDPRLLSALATGGGTDQIFRRPTPRMRPGGAVTVLIDCSGSMKSAIPQVAVLVDLLVRALDGADVPCEVLGYTTGAWSGGRPYREWLAAGRPAHPGRLNESLNLVFKDAATSWRRSRRALSGLLWTPTFREGIDGEALEWAHSRLRAIDAQRRYLLLVCDGSPMDGATALTNDEDYLDRHLIEVVESIEADPTVHLAGLGIGHDMSTYLRRSRVVDPDRILDRETARAILGFLAQP
ncbi:MAG: cobaltochelatase CobT-related protein [Actinomycetota bacterium]